MQQAVSELPLDIADMSRFLRYLELTLMKKKGVRGTLNLMNNSWRFLNCDYYSQWNEKTSWKWQDPIHKYATFERIGLIISIITATITTLYTVLHP